VARSSVARGTVVNAALSGVDVQLMMPGPHIDKGFPFWAAESYFRLLLEAGGRIFLYQDGFFHSKTLTIDSEAFAVGTLNLDIRALKLHKELMLWVYDKDIAREHEKIFLADRERCEEVTLEEVLGWSTRRKFRNSAARLASNLL
jgi:cardiolipin synthase